MSAKFPFCDKCYFHDREPAICEECEAGSEYEPEEIEEEDSLFLLEAA